jgi:PDZ domain/Secretion system C-terminal sorting domain
MYGQLLLRSSLGVLLVGTCLFAPAQKNGGERKVRIEITRNENGNKSHVTREFDLNDERQLADALRELGVLDELNVIGDDENLVIDFKRMREGGLLNDMSMAMSLADIGNSEPSAYLGVNYGDWSESCDPDKRKNGPPVKEGACITSVEENTPAEKAGLKDGDVIVAMDSKKIGSGSDLVAAIDAHKPGDKVKVTYYRGRSKNVAEVILAGRRSESSSSWNWNNWQEDHNRDMDAHNRDMEAHGRDMEAHERAMEVQARTMEAWNRSMAKIDSGGFLGVEGDDVDGGKGVRITHITDSSAAERMGLKEGDVVRSINGKNVEDFDDLAEALDGLQAGTTVQVLAKRDDKEITFSGALGKKRPIMWTWSGDGQNGFEMPAMPEMPEMPAMPEAPEFWRQDGNGRMDPQIQEEINRAMDEVRAEMDRLRAELRSEVVNEMRVTVDAPDISPEEISTLKNKGVANLENDLDLPSLQIYPSPADGSFNISFEAPVRGDLNVDLHDAKGERVYHETISGFKGHYERVLDWSDRPDGVYFVVIGQNGKAQARKLVK